MPPTIPLVHVTRCWRPSIERANAPTRRTAAATPLASLFAGLSLHQHQPLLPSSQIRRASILSNLRDNKGAYSKRIRKGRGASSGYGKTSGRGSKGQGQHGKVNPWFQGGQTPLIFKHGRMGFTNRGKEDLAEVNLTRLQAWIDAGRIDPTKPITPKELLRSRLINSVPDGVKILAHGRYEPRPKLKQPLTITASRASASAIRAIEAAGGTIVTRYYTKDAIKNLLAGRSVHSDKPLPVGKEFVEQEVEKARAEGFLRRLPDPVGRWHIEYYRDPAHRGYLSHQLAPGETPSLYFKVPQEVTQKRTAKAAKKGKKDVLFDLR